jgi:AraC-like DNA-binding protein
MKYECDCRHGRLCAGAEAVSMSFESGSPQAEQVTREAILAVAVPARLIPPGSLASWRARRVRLYIEAHLAERLDTELLARVALVSRSHFCRAFKRTFGITVHRYVMQRRMARAQQLMLTTSITLSDIAIACGMSDHSHFARLFRRVVEEPPAVWRKLNQEDIGCGPRTAITI